MSKASARYEVASKRVLQSVKICRSFFERSASMIEMQGSFVNPYTK